MTDNPARLFLSPPHMSGQEINFIQEAFTENYITTAGTNLQAFEQEFCATTDAPYAVALNTGTAAIHLALRLLEIQPGDEVLCSSLTFTATANPVLYEKALPVFIDSERDTWNMCPAALAEAIRERRRLGKKPKAIILVHLYGMPAKVREIRELAEAHDIPLIEDAAEALGSTLDGQPLGNAGLMGIYSFNGNKIITTSGGGMLVTGDPALAEKVVFLASQAKDPAPHYQHSQLGFNYRMSNIAAGIGRGQLAVLGERIRQKRAVYDYYREQLDPLAGLTFQEEPAGSFSNRWLSCLLLPADSPVKPEDLRLALEKENIESRPIWKPLHLQPLFAGAPYYGGHTGEDIFNRGLCLPSGSALRVEDQERVVAVLNQTLKAN